MKKIKTLIVVMLTITMLAPKLVGAKDQTSPADLGQPSVKKQTLEPETSKATETQKEKQTSKERETQKEKKKKLITSPAIQKYEMFKRDYEFDKDNAIEAFWGDVTDKELVEILKYMDKKGEDKGRVLTGAVLFWEELEGKIEKLENKKSKKERESLELQFTLEYNNERIVLEERDRRMSKLVTKTLSKSGCKTIGLNCGPGDGNKLDYKKLNKYAVKGDILLADNDGWVLQGGVNHAGIYDGNATSDNNKVILSAQPFKGVLIESTDKWAEDYNYSHILTVKGLTDEEKSEAYDTVAEVAEIGEWYNPIAFKNDSNNWYCSKVPSGRITLN